MFQSAGRIIGWLKGRGLPQALLVVDVSIRRADYWLVEVDPDGIKQALDDAFQSAGRIIGWLKPVPPRRQRSTGLVSIRRADYWLVEAVSSARCERANGPCFNPPGGLLVG